VVTFTGSPDAELFSREISESFKGALERDYVSQPDGKFPAGFLRASPIPQAFWDTMWTRDGGTFARELIFWGDYQHACQVAQCLIDFSGTDADGFVAFPRSFSPGDAHKTGTEIDGHCGIVIAMIALWQRLPADNPFRARLYAFLHQPSSPLRYLHHQLAQAPLIAGSGEFGGGCAIGIPDSLNDNVVQNAYAAAAFLSAANMEEEAGDHATAAQWRADAATIFGNMEKYLVDDDGSWIWCITPGTLKKDPVMLQAPVNVGFGGLNAVSSVSADVFGFDPSTWPDAGLLTHSEKTFEKLYSFPLRKQQFDKYGFWSQFDIFRNGLGSGPSYGQGYALQDMLLFDKLAMAGKAIDFLAEATFHSAADGHFPNGRLSPYYFYERLNSPDAPADVVNDTGCGALNLVNVSEPLKSARLILGVDDTSLQEVRIMPRVPPSWSGYHAENWPILTSHGVVRADLMFERKNGAVTFSLKVISGGAIPKLAVRLPGKGKDVWKRREDVREVLLKSEL